MKQRMCLSALAAAWLIAHVAASAQEAAEIAVYSAWFSAAQGSETARAYGLASDYLAKYPNGQNAPYVAKWIVGARATLFNEAIKAKNVAEMLRFGQDRLREAPDDLDYLLAMALALRRLELFASPPDHSHGETAAELSRRAIQLLDGGKTPAGGDAATWNKDDTLAWLHQTLAVVAAKADRPDDALASFERSSHLDPDNASLNAYNWLRRGSLHKDKYDNLAARFKAATAAAEPQPAPDAAPTDAAKELLAQANREADAAIDCWSRFVALAGPMPNYRPVISQVEKTAAVLYAYRHPDDPSGFPQLVARHRNP